LIQDVVEEGAECRARKLRRRIRNALDDLIQVQFRSNRVSQAVQSLERARLLLEGLLRLFGRRDVVRDLRRSNNLTARVAHGRDSQRDIEAMTVLVNPQRLVAVDPLAAANPRQDLGFLVVKLRGNDPCDGLADHLLGGEAKQPLRPFVPGDDDALQGFANNAVFGGVNYGRQMRPLTFQLAQIGGAYA